MDRRRGPGPSGGGTGRAIGKGGKNLKVAQMLASRHTEIQSVSVA